MRLKDWWDSRREIRERQIAVMRRWEVAERLLAEEDYATKVRVEEFEQRAQHKRFMDAVNAVVDALQKPGRIAEQVTRSDVIREMKAQRSDWGKL